MIINLKNILTIYVCPDHNEKYNKRKNHMDKLLIELGFTNFIHYKSSSEKYPFCLNNATIDIFSKYKPPFLFLEDDIECNFDTISDELNIPDDTDAFYLGLSKVGGHKYNNYNEGSSEFLQTNYDNILKIKNMLSAHAILYISPKYIHNLRNLLITKPTYYNDVIMSQNQYKYNVYCYDYCYFYQSNEYDGHEEATRFKPLANILPLANDVPLANILPLANVSVPNTLTYVTAFLNINNCDVNQYFPYFEKLANSGIPIVLFMDSNYKNFGEYIIQTYSNVKILKYITKNDLYVNQFIQNKKLPSNRNHKKDTYDYLALMNNKIYFVEEAMKTNLYSTDIFAWIDFRVFHIFSNNQSINNKLMELSYNIYKNDITYFPGNLSIIKNIVNSINWRYLGGFFIISKNKIIELVNETTKLLNQLDILTWEVNIWAILEFNKVFDFNWYFSNHNNSLILHI
jgi:hypothetical protein